MSYAVRKDGQGWRAVDGVKDCGVDEDYVIDQPAAPVVPVGTDARLKRDALLAACDWTQCRDVSDAVATAWQPYRKALRDLTKQSGFPESVTWPVMP